MHPQSIALNSPRLNIHFGLWEPVCPRLDCKASDTPSNSCLLALLPSWKGKFAKTSCGKVAFCLISVERWSFPNSPWNVSMGKQASYIQNCKHAFVEKVCSGIEASLKFWCGDFFFFRYGNVPSWECMSTPMVLRARGPSTWSISFETKRVQDAPPKSKLHCGEH